MWDRVRPHLTQHGVFERIENGVLNGMADVHFCLAAVPGWIELKVPGRFPMKLKGWRKEQIVWTVRRCWHSDRCFGLIQDREGRLLLLRFTREGIDAIKDINEVPLVTLEQRAIYIADSPIMVAGLHHALAEA